MAKYSGGITGDSVCACGQHKGEGDSSPYQLAQIYAWFKDRKPLHMTRENWLYLESYERRHGRIHEYIFGKERPLDVELAETEQANHNLTEQEIFSTRLGKLSLKQGWANSYLLVCQRNGIPSQDDDVLLKFQQGQSDADTEAFYLEGKEDEFSRTWLKLRKTMNEKNNYWKGKYGHLVDAQTSLAAPESFVQEEMR